MASKLHSRSTLSIVTTYVTNALIYTLIVAALLSIFARVLLPINQLPPTAEAAMVVAIYCLSCALATIHAFSYLRRSKAFSNPSACVVPSIASFAGVVGAIVMAILRVQLRTADA